MIKAGAVATTKRNLSQNIEPGLSILVTKCPGVQAPHVEKKSGKEALYLLFERRADAELASRLLLARPTAAPAQAELATALAKAMGPESEPQSIRHFQLISAEWRALCESEEPVDDELDERRARLLGKTIVLNLPVFSDDGSRMLAMYEGDAEVTEHVGDGVYKVTFTHEQVERTVEVVGSMLEHAMAEMEAPAPEAIIVFPETVKGNAAIKLIKALPISRKITSPLHADAAEVLQVFKSAGLISSDLQISAEGVRDMALTLIGNLEIMVKVEGWEALSHPDADPKRLGEQIKRQHDLHAEKVAGQGSRPRPQGKQPAPAAQHPRVAMLRALALDDSSWDMFLSDSIAVTCDTDRRGALLSGSEYMRKGALEAYLRQRGEDASPAALAALCVGSGGSWSSDQLMEYIMLTIDPQQVGKAGSSSSTNPTRIVVQTSDLSGTDEERSMRLQLQHSFESVSASSGQVSMLKKLVALTGAEDSAALLKELKSGGDDLKRVCSSEIDVEKALQGNSHRRARSTRASIHETAASSAARS